MKRLILQATRFFLVGLSATATHFFVFFILMRFEINPLIANVFAFLIAFQVSFFGHFSWSFKDSDSPRRLAKQRFFIISIGSFLVNEAMLAGLLQWSTLGNEAALLIVLFSVAGATFLFSKFWAFSHKPSILSDQ